MVGIVQGHLKWCHLTDHNMTFCWSAIVSIALCCSISELFGTE